MSCDSWIFVHKHIANADDGNGRIIERKVLWNIKSWELGEQFACYFALSNGTYRSTCSEYLLNFAEQMLTSYDPNVNPDEHEALIEITGLLQDVDPRDDFFVSVDW